MDRDIYVTFNLGDTQRERIIPLSDCSRSSQIVRARSLSRKNVSALAISPGPSCRDPDGAKPKRPDTSHLSAVALLKSPNTQKRKRNKMIKAEKSLLSLKEKILVKNRTKNWHACETKKHAISQKQNKKKIHQFCKKLSCHFSIRQRQKINEKKHYEKTLMKKESNLPWDVSKYKVYMV